MTQIPHTVLRLSAAESAAVRKALSIYTALALGQLESVYWHLLHPGVLPQSHPGDIRLPANSNQLAEIAEHLDRIKTILGYPLDQCNPINHPHTHESVRLAYALEQQLTELDAANQPALDGLAA